MEKLESFALYKKIKEHYEEQLEKLSEQAENMAGLNIPIAGNLQYANQQSQTAIVLEQQVIKLQNRLREVIAIIEGLMALAQARAEKNEFGISPLLEEFLLLDVKYYVDTYKNNKVNKPSNGKNAVKHAVKGRH